MSFWCYNTLPMSEQPHNTLTMSEQSQTPALRVPPYSEEAERGVLGSILLVAIAGGAIFLVYRKKKK